MLDIHDVVQLPHLGVGDRTGQFRQGGSDLRMPLQDFPAEPRPGLLGWEIASVVLGVEAVERCDLAVSRVSRGEIHLSARAPKKLLALPQAGR